MEEVTVSKKTIKVKNLRAILLDCNGVIVDDEPIHLRLFQKVLREEGIPLTRKQYFEKYLALDDRSCFRDILRIHKRPLDDSTVRSLVLRKAAYYREAIKTEVRIFPGVENFVRAHSGAYKLAVISGARREEIDWILNHAGLADAFSAIVSTEDVAMGKPSPESYRKGLRLLNRLPALRRDPLRAGECAAVEDSIHGVEAAKAAGMKCLAVTNSYSRKELGQADWVAESLKGLRFLRS